MEKSFVCYYLKSPGIYRLTPTNTRKRWSQPWLQRALFFPSLGKGGNFCGRGVPVSVLWQNVFSLSFHNIIYSILLLKIWLDDELNRLEILLLPHHSLFNHPEILIQSYFKLLPAYIFTCYTHNYKLHPVLVDSSSLAILSLENWL